MSPQVNGNGQRGGQRPGGRRGGGARRGGIWTARAILRILFACALAAIVIWGGGGIFSGLQDREEDRPPQGDEGGNHDNGSDEGGDENGGVTPSNGSAPADARTVDDSGIRACGEDELSDEAADVIDTIAEGGEFQYPQKDGSTFGNREGLLPAEEHGYYAEYTVPTPGSPDRGARRIVTGGDSTPRDGSTDPEHWYWTADHYESFCEFAA